MVAIAKIEKDPEYNSLRDPLRRAQEKKARELHELANVPLGPCGKPEVHMFQKYLTNYEINIVSADHNNSIIHPPEPTNAFPCETYLPIFTS